MVTSPNICYSTPAWAVGLFLDNVFLERCIPPSYDTLCEANFWDPCCGTESILKSIDSYFNNGENLYGSDINRHKELYDYSFRQTDFLKADAYYPEVRPYGLHIVSNPPYSLAEEFLAKTFELLDSGVIDSASYLLRLSFLESKSRYKSIFNTRHRPDIVSVMSNRCTMYPEGAEVKGDSNTAYAWFTWLRNDPIEKITNGKTEVLWLCRD